MHPKENRFFAFLPVLFSCLMGALFCIILLLLLFAQPSFSAYYENLSQLSNLALFPASIAVLALLLWLRSRETQDDKEHLWMLRGVFLLTLAVQFLVARCCWYKMGWDISVVYTTAEELGLGLELSNPTYFDLCPNNAPLTILQTLPMWIAGKIGLGVPFVALPYIDALLLNISAYLCVRCVQMLTQSRTARLFTLVLTVGWIALSPYILYPYTDSFAIPFPVLALYAWLRLKKPAFKWLAASLLCFFGACVKPTVLIFLIALVILGVCQFLAKKDFSIAAWKRAAVIALVVILGAIPGRVFQQAATAYLAGSTKPEGQLSATHYLMLGMNGDTFGGHSVGDVEFSTSYESLDERQRANLARAWERLSSRSLAENAHFFAVKAYKAYADGSFASHNSFLELEVPKREDTLSTFLRSLYHKRGALMPYCQTLAQGLWLGVLTLCAAACIRLRKHPTVALLGLTLLGVTAYLLLFEVWPRYLFLYAPFFVILAAMAFDKKVSSR